MAYMSKLAHRLARIRRIAGVALAAAGLAYCNRAEPLSNSVESNPDIQEQSQALQPSEVTDLAAVGTSDSSVSLSFTDVDDGAGQPARYEIRYAESAASLAEAAAVRGGSCSGVVSGDSI